MALNYLEEQKKKQQQEVQPQGAYNLAGVSATTQQQLQKSQAGYQPNQQTQAAQQNLQSIQAQKPQSYSSKYSPALQSILEQIQNPGSPKYEFNGDENFKYLADLYTQDAKKANINAQGQAAALTGGYGNSYGAAAGAQAYQEALLPLYQQGMALRQQALDQYNADRADRYNQLKAVQGMDESDYGRYQDAMQNWRADLQNAQNVYQDERNFGYNEYADALANAMNIGKMESESYRADQDEAYRRDTFQQSINEFNATNELEWASLEEKKREYDAGLSEEQRQYDQKIAQTYALAILENGQIPSNELLVAAGLSYEDAQKLIAKVYSGPGKTKTPSLAEDIANGKVQLQHFTDYSDIREEDNKYRRYLEENPMEDITPPPATSNFDTPVHYTQETNVNGVPKTKTVTTDPISYNQMIAEMFDEALKRKK